jgi:hypothetical protein
MPTSLIPSWSGRQVSPNSDWHRRSAKRGKSTLFNAIVKNGAAQAANYPFCTIEPNSGIVAVPDERLAQLAAISKTDTLVPTSVEFVDIAGLVKGASKGEGLGNQFLANIRECDSLVQVRPPSTAALFCRASEWSLWYTVSQKKVDTQTESMSI